MAHLKNWFGLLRPDIVTILVWWESLHRPLYGGRTQLCWEWVSGDKGCDV